MTDYNPDIDNKLKAQGICPLDLHKALALARDFRIQVVKANIGPKATRIALLTTELIDRHVARENISSLDMIELQLIAQGLYEIAKETL